ncbi:toprim domain-containing protein [Streptomyces paludis]|uniref:Topoisomerase n=1 Tax=Streptomyces paludis TaxID=2282738 RepID=A0A345HWQ9_9ACTN|nr:toprim domain-containing protein [Streptomyces paludis]AXG81133.1 topoisomerase [Streptomyces paludis]
MLSTEQRRFFEQAVTQYQNDLAADTGAQEYLASRGLGPEAAGQFRLGVVTSPLAGHERYAGRLAIPYVTPAGPVNIRFRCAEAHACEGHAKYLSLPDAASNLYNVLDLKKVSPFICVTEGEIDAMTLSLAGLPAVGIPGVSTWQQHYARCLEDFDVIYAFGDGDDAGGKLNSFLAREARARPISMPKGMDCNDIYREHGAAGLRALID